MLDLNRQLKDGEQSAEETDDLFGSAEEFSEKEETETFDAGKEEDFPEDNTVEEYTGPVSVLSGKRKKRRNTADAELDKLDAARILEEARCRMGLTPADVEEITKIRAVYITALEKGDFDELPQPVYTLAYLRRLCELYGLSKEEEEEIILPWSELQFETPDNYSTTVYSDESGDNRKVIRKLEITIFSIIALAVIALVVFGVILLVSFVRSNVGSSNVSFDEAEIGKIQPEQKLQVSEPMPQLRPNSTYSSKSE